MSSGEVLKADKDFSKETDAAIPEAEKLGAVCLDALSSWAKLTEIHRATHKPVSTSCLHSRRRPARYITSAMRRSYFY
jgi:hypothetical protein